MREEYYVGELTESEAHPDAIRQFARWFQEAVDHGLREPNAMTLATASAAGAPSARMVLLKGFDEEGFVFYTNYGSEKANELDENPRAALVFYWALLERQVRIEGTVTPTSREETGVYFQSRPRGSQLSAWASAQSTVVAGRSVLEDRLRALERQFDGKPVPAPPQWGGYRVKPSTIEFWQGRPNRLHDRLRYVKQGGGWRIERLSP